MSWREELTGSATFRGVPFRTTDAAIGVGRRNVLNEYPLRDTPYVDDLGRRARRYDVEGYLLGEDYLAQRDALIAALEEPGPGELVHPRYGAVWVSLQEAVRFKESPREGGIARFSAVFVEDSDNRQPSAERDTVSELQAAAEAMDLASGVAYVEALDLIGPELLALLQVADWLTDIQALLAAARLCIAPDALGPLESMAGVMAGEIVQLVRDPPAMVARLQALHLSLALGVGQSSVDGGVMAGQLAELQRDPVDLRPGSASGALSALRAINLSARAPLLSAEAIRRAAMSGAPLALTTSSRVDLNGAARAGLTRRLAMTTQARILAIAITDDVIATRDQATAWRDQIVEQIDAELELADPDAATARALSRLRAAAVRDVAVRAELLKQRSTYRSAAVLPSLVLAHRIYLDASRADELVQRNAVAHPAFVPAGPLEILR